jgi:hypothetical protein
VRTEEGVRVDAPATYLSWGFILISIPNVLMIIGMIVVFIAALIVPFPHRGRPPVSKEPRHE